MRAIVIKKYGGPDVLSVEERPDPKPLSGHVLIEVKAFGVNQAETHMSEGKWPQATEISGIECAGRVRADPDGRYVSGQTVVAFMGGMGRSINGSYAELTRVPKRADGLELLGAKEVVLESSDLATPARVFRFEEIREAHRLMAAGAANGKIVVRL